MKRSLLIVCACGAWISAQAAIITQWNFNSVPPDGSNSTGTNVPSVGMGTALVVGPVTATFSDGCTNDPASGTDDSGWNTTHYPSQGTSNKLGGVQFNVSTLGYSNIVVRWDQRVSTTGSKYYRMQYTTDGVDFEDCPAHVTIVVGAPSATYYEAQTNDFSATAGVNNNPNFGVRIVSELEDSATGSGTTNYATPFGTNTYSTAGTVRFDWVTILGTLIPGANTPPTISSIPSFTNRVNHSTGPLDFTVMDAEDPATNLTLNATSSDNTVIPVANVVFGGTSANRSVTVTAGAQSGVSTITVWVTDTGGRSNSTAFTVKVLPENTAPLISTLAATNTLINTATAPLNFTVSDFETAAADLTVSATSANSVLVPNGNIAFGGGGSNRTVSVTPAPGQTGVAPITITVSDGTNTTDSVFAVMVRPSAAVIFYDPFSYADGSLLTNSGFLWANRSGTDGEAQVTNGQLLVSADLGEDVVGRLAGATFATGTGTVLYASFRLTALTLPKVVPDYFAHFASGTTLRGRILAGTTNAAPGSFGLFVANGSDTNTALGINLATNTAYIVVTRYNIDTATTTLWLNPATEADPGTTATDAQTAVPISNYGFRESDGVGAELLVDDLKVGLSFNAVITNSPPPLGRIPLKIARVGSSITLTWTNADFSLQSAPIVTGPYTNIPGATSPHTTPATGARKFFRLEAN